MDSKFTDTGLLLLLSLWAGQYVVGRGRPAGPINGQGWSRSFDLVLHARWVTGGLSIAYHMFRYRVATTAWPGGGPGGGRGRPAGPHTGRGRSRSLDLELQSGAGAANPVPARCIHIPV